LPHGALTCIRLLGDDGLTGGAHHVALSPCIHTAPDIVNTSVADPGCFILDPGSGTENFFLSNPGYWILDPTSYVKRGVAKVKILSSCYLRFQEYGKF
jgi:hypothetical protein